MHSNPGASATTARVEMMKQPNVSSAGTSKDWQYFLSCWEDYARATILAGSDRVITLLEFCDKQLRKDLTQTAGGTFTDKMKGVALAATGT